MLWLASFLPRLIQIPTFILCFRLSRAAVYDAMKRATMVIAPRILLTYKIENVVTFDRNMTKASNLTFDSRQLLGQR